jgi:ABC-2 type transport system permease protein
MNSILVITKKEVNSYFDSLMAYILIILFLLFTGYFTWFFKQNTFIVGEASLSIFFTWAFWTLFFFVPGITMGTLAEEKSSGTIEMLATKSVSSWQIIIGKFFSSWMLVLFALLLTIPYYITISKFGNIDQGAAFGGYLGVFLISGAYISIGIFVSSFAKNQIIAFLLTLTITIFFQWIFGLVSANMIGLTGEVFNYMSFNYHFFSISRGVIDLRDILYFGSIIFTALFLAKYMLSKRVLID